MDQAASISGKFRRMIQRYLRTIERRGTNVVTGSIY